MGKKNKPRFAMQLAAGDKKLLEAVRKKTNSVSSAAGVRIALRKFAGLS